MPVGVDSRVKKPAKNGCLRDIFMGFQAGEKKKMSEQIK